MYTNNEIQDLSSLDTIYQYDIIDPTSPIQSLNESNLSAITKQTSLIPSFQKHLPLVFIAILGLFEILAGLMVVILEILIFDIAIGLWCGFIYLIVGIAVLIYVISTDHERHQTSILLIIQFIAFMFTISEIFLHMNAYHKRCTIESTGPLRQISYYCKILLIQIGGTSIVLVSTIMFAIVYLRVTIMVLKRRHGTFNITNAMNITC